MPGRTRFLSLLLAAALVVGPGCVLGSPLAMISGEPYGQTIDDLDAIGGRKKGPIWGGAPVFAAIDLPFAAVLDTGFLPIALMIWGLKQLGSDDRDHHHGPGDHDHVHGDGEADHSH